MIERPLLPRQCIAPVSLQKVQPIQETIPTSGIFFYRVGACCFGWRQHSVGERDVRRQFRDGFQSVDAVAFNAHARSISFIGSARLPVACCA
ncbi:MAG: hypothetical protein ACREPL_12270 [Rhodanobacteraceae bacterium]